MLLSSEVAFGGTLEFYWVESEYVDDKPYWFNVENKWYLYHLGSNWQISTRLGSDNASFYGQGKDPCPTGYDNTWKMISDDKWVTIPDFSITSK